MKTKKQTLRFLLDASNRHEAVLRDMRNEINGLKKTTEAIAYKNLSNDFDKAKLSEVKSCKSNDVEFAHVIDVVSKVIAWSEANTFIASKEDGWRYLVVDAHALSLKLKTLLEEKQNEN